MFYHSFPRPKHGQDSIQKGLKILESFLKNGILFTPEIITYKQEKTEYHVAQSRFCLTQIDISELKAHEKYFGGFHLEFTNHGAYSLGAMPVFYLPSAEPGKTEWPLKKLAAVYLHHLHELKNICLDIQGLNEMLKGEKDGAIQIQRKNGADGQAHTYTFDVKQLRGVLDMITENLIPNPAKPEERYRDIGACMDNFLGALQGIGSMFYPADKDYEGEHVDLYYFRQREWRITAGSSVDGKHLDKKLNGEQKKMLMSIDSDFFGKEMVYADMVRRSRIDGCTVMPMVIYKTETEPGEKETEPKIETKPVQKLVERIIVPKEALEEARAVAKRNNFDLTRVVDFVTAMQLAALELEYESEKNRCRIQLIRAAQAEVTSTGD